jgi:hypothetical protein
MNNTTTDGVRALQHQCEEKRVRCLYTSTTFFEWLGILRLFWLAFIVIPIVFGSLASWQLLKANANLQLFAAVLAFIAGLAPVIYSALKMDEHLASAARLTGEYKNLEIAFADLERIGPHKGFSEFEDEYKAARARLERANAEAYTAPDWCHQRAKKKIERGEHARAAVERYQDSLRRSHPG